MKYSHILCHGASRGTARFHTDFGQFADSGSESVNYLSFCPPAGPGERKSQQSNKQTAPAFRSQTGPGRRLIPPPPACDVTVPAPPALGVMTSTPP